jgi:nucleoside-diphosphate-sugar epimerase
MELYGGLPQDDVFHIKEKSIDLSSEILQSNFVIIGASGFLGRWLSTSLTYMSNENILMGSLTLMSRDTTSLNELRPHLNMKQNKSISTQDISKDKFFHLTSDRTIVVFAATSTSESGKPVNALKSGSIELAKKVVESLPTSNNHFVHLSSGGIYDPKARLLPKIPRDYPTQTFSQDHYVNEKILLEKWTEATAASGELTVRNPRLFSFYGPGLQLDRHFVIGEFISRARQGLSLEIRGNPANLRSYLYPTEAVLQVLLQCGSIPAQYSHIGSSNPYSILEIAGIVADLFKVDILVNNVKENGVNNYVPEDVPIVRERPIQEGLKVWENWLRKQSFSR